MNSFNGSKKRTVDVQEVLEQIKKGYWKKQVEDIQYHINNGENKQVSELKSKLPAFTISATYKYKRKPENLESYSGLLHLDYDKLDNIKDVKSKIISNSYTYAAFVSPSGKGLKVLVKCDNNMSSHTFAFNALRNYYDNFLEVKSDKSVKDVLRLCFVSYDSDLYLNKNSKFFKYQSYPINETQTQKDIKLVWDFTSNKQQFIEGNRNNFIYLFAHNAKGSGYDITETLDYAYNYHGSTFSKEEIKRSINSAFKNNENEKGTFAKPAISAILPKEIPHKITNPLIPDYIYDVLPPTLKEACNVFKERERDVLFTSALSVISGGLHNVSGLYANDKVFPNLFSIIIAPPASGKGVMKYSRQLGDCSHDFLLHQSREDLKEYKNQKRVFNLKVKKAKTDQAIEALIEPEKPKSKMFFIPGDTSSAMIVKHLEDNDGMGCICETEADALTNALKQEWGGFSNIIRRGFQGEIISQSRKTDLEYTEIKEPKFSLALTGTPNQLDILMTSVQDGLFSRVLFYSFNAAPIWKNTYTSAISKSNKEIFEDYSAALCDKFKSNTAQKFAMTQEQGLKLDNTFSELLIHNTAIYDEDASGTIKRLGLMCYKIAMTLSAIRSDDTEIICSDDDFNTALFLVKEVYLVHGINMLNRITKSSKKLNSTQTALYNWIQSKDDFQRSEISEQANLLGIKDRTLSDILNRFIELNLIERLKQGVYVKR